MAEEMSPIDERLWTVLDLPMKNLAALGQVPGLAAGGLSPLVRVTAPEAPPDPVGMDRLLDDIEKMSPWAPAALLDPQLTAGIIVGNEDTPSLRQYAWPDAEGRGPGFEFAVTAEALQMRGPMEIVELREGMAALLRVDELVGVPALTMTLTAGQFWALTAIFDAHRTALGIRRLSRLGGMPLGVMVPDVIEAWKTGLQTRNPGWAVSLFSMLVPDAVPESFEMSLRQALGEMDDADLLMVLDGDLSAGPGATIVFGEDLEALASGLASQLFLFGLTVQHLRAPGEVEVTALGGWRTPGALWLVDLSGIENDEVQLVFAGGELMVEMLDELLGGEPDPDFAMDTPYASDTLRAKLAVAPTAPEPAAPEPAVTAPTQVRFCKQCGAELTVGGRFCGKCRAAIDEPEAEEPAIRYCQHCGAQAVPGARFCNGCGREL